MPITYSKHCKTENQSESVFPVPNILRHFHRTSKAMKDVPRFFTDQKWNCQVEDNIMCSLHSALCRYHVCPAVCLSLNITGLLNFYDISYTTSGLKAVKQASFACKVDQCQSHLLKHVNEFLPILSTFLHQCG